MGIWDRIVGGRQPAPGPVPPTELQLDLPGWTESSARPDMRVWHDHDGDVISLTVSASDAFPVFTTDDNVQEWARSLAESRGGGLVEARLSNESQRRTARLVYKRLEMPAYSFTGMLVLLQQSVVAVWTVVCRERGTTGVREALVTQELLASEAMTIDEYETSWARDPYRADYQSVDRSVLRFMSDDESYDQRFPDHPLSKTRRLLDHLVGLDQT